MEFNYSYLRGYIRDNNQIRTENEFAKLIGITPQNLGKKFANKGLFSQEQILTVKEKCNLTPQQVDLYFFTRKFQ